MIGKLSYVVMSEELFVIEMLRLYIYLYENILILNFYVFIDYNCN